MVPDVYFTYLRVKTIMFAFINILSNRDYILSTQTYGMQRFLLSPSIVKAVFLLFNSHLLNFHGTEF